MKMKRRTFLASTAAAGGGIGLGLLVNGCVRREAIDTLIVETAEQLRYEPGARLLGQAYLDQAPEEKDRDQLIARIIGSLPSLPADATGDDVTRLLLDQIRRDFEQDQAVRVDGWLLSVTEARLCALALSAQDG